jgi:hypothetical protein
MQDKNSLFLKKHKNYRFFEANENYRMLLSFGKVGGLKESSKDHASASKLKQNPSQQNLASRKSVDNLHRTSSAYINPHK